METDELRDQKRKEAIELVGALKGLMPMLTDHQAAMVVNFIVSTFAPVDWVAVFRRYACENEQFNISTFRNTFVSMQESGNAWDRRAYENTRAEAERIGASNAADNAACEALSDQQFNDAADSILSQLEPDLAAFLRRRPGRKQQFIRSKVAEYARMHGWLQATAGGVL